MSAAVLSDVEWIPTDRLKILLDNPQFGIRESESSRAAIEAHDDLRICPNKRLAETFQAALKVQANLSEKFHLAGGCA